MMIRSVRLQQFQTGKTRWRLLGFDRQDIRKINLVWNKNDLDGQDIKQVKMEDEKENFRGVEQIEQFLAQLSISKELDLVKDSYFKTIELD